ncbi:heparinase II/III domain-containing protein [Paenibacillus woosongensis]|uniref:Heparinase II/III-like C-terminal domain-containing protein n=1 Tax=Paenibacillus woosongensis TaxID=307580 RepID=A0ABQ4MWG6_9BACL|nr:heparinase II/III family protein [Paenibacillus woosongensis]GIP60269.1 hypothetical protein J15TS10_40830 [Paenibacillus woosongensis]
MSNLTIKEALHQGMNSTNKVMLFSEGKTKDKWHEIKSNPYFQPWITQIKKESIKMLDEVVPNLSYSLFSLYNKTGSRKEYESIYFARRKRLNVFAFITLLEGDQRYIEALEDMIWSICDEYTWCLPAHVKSETDIRKQIDLFAAETAFTLAEIIYLLEDQLSVEIKKRVKKEIFERVLEPYCSEEHVFFWETATTNWASVCAGSIGATAIYMVEDHEKLSSIITTVLNTLTFYLKGFHNDGVCLEGISYWQYGFGYYVYFSELLRQRTANKIDLMDQYKIFKIALFHQTCYLSGNFTVSFSDAFPQEKYHVGLLHQLKRKYPEIELPEDNYKINVLDDPNARWAPFIRDFLWSDYSLAGQAWKELAIYYNEAQWFITRQEYNERMVAFAAKAGHNNEPHNHNDVGSFIFHVQGETFIADIGAGEYTKQYFQKDSRYLYFPTRSKGHSVPIIGGKEQMHGSSKSAIFEVKQSEKLDIFSFEMTGAYNNENLNKLTRTYTIKKIQNYTIEIEDYFEFLDYPESIIERFISYYKPVVITKGIIRLEGKQNNVDILYDPALFGVSVEEHQFISHNLENTIVYSVDFQLKAVQIWNKVNIIIELQE